MAHLARRIASNIKPLFTSDETDNGYFVGALYFDGRRHDLYMMTDGVVVARFGDRCDQYLAMRQPLPGSYANFVSVLCSRYRDGVVQHKHLYTVVQ